MLGQVANDTKLGFFKTRLGGNQNHYSGEIFGIYISSPF